MNDWQNSPENKHDTALIIVKNLFDTQNCSDTLCCSEKKDIRKLLIKPTESHHYRVNTSRPRQNDDKSTLNQIMDSCHHTKAITWENVDSDLCHQMTSLRQNYWRYGLLYGWSNNCNCHSIQWHAILNPVKILSSWNAWHLHQTIVIQDAQHSLNK